jgi:hypothetical protein
MATSTSFQFLTLYNQLEKSKQKKKKEYADFGSYYKFDSAVSKNYCSLSHSFLIMSFRNHPTTSWRHENTVLNIENH